MPLTDIPLSSLLEQLPRGVKIETRQTDGRWSWRCTNPSYAASTWTRETFATEHEAVSHAIDSIWQEE